MKCLAEQQEQLFNHEVTLNNNQMSNPVVDIINNMAWKSIETAVTLNWTLPWDDSELLLIIVVIIWWIISAWVYFYKKHKW